MSNLIPQTSKAQLINLFKNILNILRNNETLIGDKALRTMSYLLVLKLIEPHINKTIDINNYQFDFSHIHPNIKDKYKEQLFNAIYFSNLLKIDEGKIPNLMKDLWDDVLSKHPITKNIFTTGNGFNINKVVTYKKILILINEIQLNDIDFDLLGETYEEVIQDIMTGKVLGQFFTQPIIKKIMVKLIEPKLFDDGTIETCCDPTMGTGGFLISYLQDILKQAKQRNIKPNWNFITQNGIHGKEIEPDTYQLALSNMLISSGHIFNKLEKGDSIREPIINKFDNILANPPYGINGLNYDEINNNIKSVYIPIQTNNAVSLFLQAIIYMLKINGKCAILLPDGKDLNSKINSFVTIREYLMKTCDLQKVISLPNKGLFKNTNIRTCILYFEKRIECTGIDILNRPDLQTKDIKFYEYDEQITDLKLLGNVNIEKIKLNSYSINFNEYSNDINTTIVSNNVINKKLGDICIFLSKSKRPASYGKSSGLYPFYKSSNKLDSYVDIADYNQESLIIGDGGEPNVNYGINFSTSDHCYVLQNMDTNNINLKYVYYYLYNNLNIMNQYYTGIGIKNISKTNIKNILIKIPPIEIQNDIVNYCDSNLNKIKQLEMEIENTKNSTKNYIYDMCHNNQSNSQIVNIEDNTEGNNNQLVNTQVNTDSVVNTEVNTQDNIESITTNLINLDINNTQTNSDKPKKRVKLIIKK